MNLPIDFEQKVKMPPQVGGRSYPYQISARDLMQNFRYAALQVDTSNSGNGLTLTETVAIDGTRTVGIDGQSMGNTVEVLVVENGSFKLGNFYIQGELTPI